MTKFWSIAPWICLYGNLLAWPVVDAVFSSPFDPNFACCGGCSSSQRGDAYNNKLTNGARVFIWDIKLKVNPAPVCLLTFPYDRALNEQEGDRRVRSGRLVGTSYPIDHDLDALCCEQRGLCQLLEEDASGKCQCVKKWGFTGDHCEHSGAFNVARLFEYAVPDPVVLPCQCMILPQRTTRHYFHHASTSQM
jgi:hypothetical protein